MTKSKLDHGFLHGFDDTLFDHDARLGGVLDGFLGRPFGADGETKRPLVLLLVLELVRKLSGHVLVVLDKC